MDAVSPLVKNINVVSMPWWGWVVFAAVVVTVIVLIFQK